MRAHLQTLFKGFVRVSEMVFVGTLIGAAFSGVVWGLILISPYMLVAVGVVALVWLMYFVGGLPP